MTLLGASAVLLAATAKKSSSSASFLIILVVIVAALYFLFLRPQQQKARRQRETMTALDVGDEIVTVGGIQGTILSVDSDKVTIETGAVGPDGLPDGAGTRIVLVRSAVARKIEKPAPDPEQADEAELHDGEGGAPQLGGPHDGEHDGPGDEDGGSGGTLGGTGSPDGGGSEPDGSGKSPKGRTEEGRGA